MAKATGRDDVKRYMAAIPGYCRTKLLPGAARAGAKVIADEARDRCESDRVAAAIVVKARPVTDDTIRVVVTVKRGFAYSLGVWLEYGTAPHFIAALGGVGARKLNKSLREKKGNLTLVIGNRPVGPEVFHTGSRAFPFLRPALDVKQAEAIRAAQNYIISRLSRKGIGPDDMDDDA
ncbi:MAG: HK97 gp10 family phage protein [Sphingomonas pseudosanguinis]|uniref:HK97 gp10 family phage protein n=1 Tax=Sphingomonas pseudosanguinis TaxID=413712 RepID=UPI00391C5C00